MKFMETLRKLKDDEDAMIPPLVIGLIGLALGALIIAVVFQIAPMVGSEVESAVTIPAASQWNATTNTAIPTGYGVWEKTSMIGVAVLIVIVSTIIGALVAIGGVGRGL